MIRQFYDGYGEHFKLSDGSDFSYPVNKCPPKKKEEVCEKINDCTKKTNPINDIFSNLNADDIVLIGVIIFLLYDGVDDYILLIILGIIFLMGIGEKTC